MRNVDNWIADISNVLFKDFTLMIPPSPATIMYAMEAAQLSCKEQTMILMCFVLGMDNAEIGKKVGMTKEEVRETLIKALKKTREIRPVFEKGLLGFFADEVEKKAGVKA